MDAHEKFNLKKLLEIDVPQERIERLRDVVYFDRGDISQEVKDFLLKEQIRFVNIQYARFLAGTHFTPADVDGILEGSIDIHAHGGSEPFDRICLEDELLQDYTRAKMRAIVIKTWYTPSASRNALLMKQLKAWAATENLEPVTLIGGITLNNSVGGLNPNAVERCLKFPGFKYIWLPMVDSYHHRKLVYDDQTCAGLHILDSSGKVLPELKEIFRIAADHDLIVASGHYPYAETAVAFEEALKIGVKRLEVVHPAHIHSKTTIAQMKEYAKEGVKLMLSGLGTLCFPLHETGPIYAAQMIEEVGADHFVYGSDFGQIHNPTHIIGTRWMIQMLLAYGVTKDDLVKIFKTNPAKHLDLE
jgi:predicted TIM-barrel fold metal-dependent hydrolase